MTVVLLVAAGVALLVGVVVIGHRMIGSESATGTFTDGMGSFMNVFDPARERADDALRSKKTQGEMLPSPDDDHPPMTVDLARGVARLRRSRG
ncbi:hypothetical protein E9934_04400 [Nocardioides caeni]|uniref:Uncharacterized protein n=1 Tax=Nocardioides caeni TaxID=574700 RepID=A0A4S8NL36_9ACTN|nr:hypothetical protein [Nocardioides caeni]THV17720.1 hypothetical protein E9934_04400 [Nocardioides caeni]